MRCYVNSPVVSEKYDPPFNSEHCDVHTLALYLNMTPRRVQQLVKRGIIPRGKRGEYDLLSCIHSYIDHLQRTLYRFSGFYSGSVPRTGRKDHTDMDLNETSGESGHVSDVPSPRLPGFDELQERGDPELPKLL